MHNRNLAPMTVEEVLDWLEEGRGFTSRSLCPFWTIGEQAEIVSSQAKGIPGEAE